MFPATATTKKSRKKKPKKTNNLCRRYALRCTACFIKRMKKLLLLIAVLCGTTALQAETVKMKDGTLISGSIVAQTEYTLNLATSYGTITLNQREIEQILPDKHRIILKGGSQLVGIITDLDEFNLKLKTDEGATVNIDMPQIVSVEPYDYDRGENAQKEFVEKTRERQEAAQAQQKATQGNAPAVVQTSGGLSFDSDINQVFSTQKATIENGSVKTNFDTSSAAAATAARPMSDEEAFIKGVKTGAVSQREVAAAAKEELSAKKSASAAPKKTAKKNEKDFYKYFAIQAGAMPLDLKLDNSDQAGYAQGDEYDLSGASVAVSGKYLWRIKDSNFWAGPTLSIANIANNSFEDKDPTLPPTITDPTVTTSGQIITLGAATNYYLNPKSRFAFYLTAQGAYQILKLNYRGEQQGHTINSSTFAGAAGLGVETWVDDVMIGLEAKQVFATHSGVLKNSAPSNTLIQAQLSWKF